jgi:hypothetical protein
MPESSDEKSDELKVPTGPDSRAFLAWLESVPDPVTRYSMATEALESHQETVQMLAALRSDALAEAAEEDSLSAVARALGVSRQRVHQLVQESKARKDSSERSTRRGRRKGSST